MGQVEGEGSEDGAAAEDAGGRKSKKKGKRRKKRGAKGGKEKKAPKGPPPRSPAELALIRTPMGRMFLTLLLIKKELLRYVLAPVGAACQSAVTLQHAWPLP